MKTLEWLRFLESQNRREGKKLFSVTELGNSAGVSLHTLNMELHRLIRRGIIVRYAQGIYGLPGAVSPEDLLPLMDNGAYFTGGYALFWHGVISTGTWVMTPCRNSAYAPVKYAPSSISGRRSSGVTASGRP